MRFVLSVIILLSSFAFGAVSAQSDSQDEIDVEINVNAHGNRVALKLDEETCQFGFPGLIEDPELLVFDENGEELHREPMGIGDWSMSVGTGGWSTGTVAQCDQAYRLSLPAAESYTIQIAPYFTEDYTAQELGNGKLDIELTRESGDPFPLPVRPEGGNIEGTDQYLLVGTLQLRGESGDEFFNMSVLGCMGLGGYSDIHAGAQIKITDQSGDIVAVTELMPDPEAEGEDECRLQFITEVPEATFYSISMGRRGDITYSFDDLEESGWLVELTLG